MSGEAGGDVAAPPVADTASAAPPPLPPSEQPPPPPLPAPPAEEDDEEQDGGAVCDSDADGDADGDGGGAAPDEGAGTGVLSGAGGAGAGAGGAVSAAGDAAELGDAASNAHLRVLKAGLLHRKEHGTLASSVKPRWVVLLPDAVAFFHKEADATVADGVLTASVAHDDLSSLRSHGAHFPLSSTAAVTNTADPLTVDIGFDTGRSTESLTAPTVDVAKEWMAAIVAAKATATAEGAAKLKPGGRRQSILQGMGKSLRNLGKRSGTAGSGEPAAAKPPAASRRKSLFGKKAPETLDEKVRRLEAERERTVAKAKAAAQKAKEREEAAKAKAAATKAAEEHAAVLAEQHAEHLQLLVQEKKSSYRAVPFPGGDLRDSANSGLLKSPRGLDAAVLSGWLTRPSKGGLRAGQRERFFVLTPEYLAYFPKEKDAKVTEDGYLAGKCAGTSTSTFKHEGARWPLETIVDVKPFVEAEAARQEERAERQRARAEMQAARAARDKAAGRTTADGDDADDDGGGDGDTAKAARVRTDTVTKATLSDSDGSGGDSDDDGDDDGEGEDGGECEGAGGGGAGDAAGAAGAGAGAPRKKSIMGRLFSRSKARTSSQVEKAELQAAMTALAPEHEATLIEVDLGERLVKLQAWNMETRDAWIASLKHWSGIRRKVLDDEAYTNWSSLAMYKSGMAFAVNAADKK